MNKKLTQKLKGRNGIKFDKQFIKLIKNPTPVISQSVELATKVLIQKKIIVYISGALTHVPEMEKKRYKQAVELVDSLGGFGYAPHIYGTDPKKHPDVSPAEVRDIDFLWSVVLPKFCINFCDYPSLGVDIEMAWAEVYNIPSIKIIQQNKKISRLARGLYDNSSIIAYKTNKDLFRKLAKEVEKLL